MFNKPKYTTEDVSNLTQDIATLTKLRDKAIQDSRLYSNENKAGYEQEAKAYTMQIVSAQKVLQFILDKLERELQ